MANSPDSWKSTEWTSTRRSATRPQGDPDRAVDGQREDEAVVVVGVFADEVYPAWGPYDPTWWLAELLLKGTGNVFFRKRHWRLLTR